MPDTIGSITVPVIAPSGTFPLVLEFPNVQLIAPVVAIHPFISGSVKIEQRFLLGNGARKWRLAWKYLTEAELSALRDFWEDRNGATQAFTFNAPSDDGDSTDAVTAYFEDQALTFEKFARGLSSAGITICELPDDDDAPSFAVDATLERFPDTELETALTGQVQELIPLIHITAKTAGYPEIYLSDRRCTVGGQLYQARLVTWSNITQRLGGQSDQARFTFGNADKVMRDLAADVDLFRARIHFSLYHVGTGIKLDLWSGDVIDFVSSAAAEFTLTAVDGLYELTLQYPIQRVSGTCRKKFNDGNECPYDAEGSGGDPLKCDKGYLTPNGCKAHNMKLRFGGIIATPQSVSAKDNSQGFWGFGRPTETATSLVNDSMMGQPLTEIYTDIPFPVKCLLVEGRDEGDFYTALGIVGVGPIGAFDTGSFNAAGLQRFPTLDGQTEDIFPKYLGRFVRGTDPAGAEDFFSLDQLGSDTGGDPNLATAGGRLYADNFSAGVAFANMRIKDEKGFQLTNLSQHSMQVYVSQGLTGWVWTAPGARTEVTLTNPIWIAINVYLRGIGQRFADATTAETFFDVDAAIYWAAVCDLTVDKIIGEGTETQFKFQGMLRDLKPLKDWIQEILNNCLGGYLFSNGKLKVFMREDAAAAHSFSGGNMLFKSLQLSPIKPTFNKIDVTFANADYEFTADMIPVQDDDRIAYDLQVLNMILNLAGAAGKSMAGRIGATRIKEENGGVGTTEWRNARRAAWATTVLALGVEVGVGVSIDDDDVPGGTGLFRVTGWTLNPDYSISLEGITITDTMYDLIAGPKATDVPANGTPAQLFPAPLMPAWFPNVEAPRTDDPVLDEFDRTVDLKTVVSDQADGSRRVEIMARGELGVNRFRYSVPPRIRAHDYSTTSGFLKGGHVYYVSICAKIGAYPTPQSNVVSVFIPAGMDTSSIELTNIHWPIGAWDGFVVFVGRDDNRALTMQVEGSGTPPTEITITGPYKQATYGPPSPVYRAPRLKIKRMLHPGVLPHYITSLDSGDSSISCAFIGSNPYQPKSNDGSPLFTDQAKFATDDWTGRTLTVLPQTVDGLSGIREGGFVPVLNFTITAYDHNIGKFTVTPDPVGAGVLPGDAFIVRFKATLSSDLLTLTDEGIINGAYPLGAFFQPQFGTIIRILSGPGRGQKRNVVSHDNVSYTVDIPFDAEDPPDETSIWGVEVATWVSFAEHAPYQCDHFGVQQDLYVQTPNMRGHAFLVMGVMIDRNQQESPEELAIVREFFVFGAPLAVGEAPFVILREKFGKLTINDTEILDDLGIGSLRAMNFFTPMVDERDAHWWFTGSIAESGDPATVQISMTPYGVSRFGASLQVGDFGIWNDPDGYEINKVIAIEEDLDIPGNFLVTLERTDPDPSLGTPSGEAYFHTLLTSHTDRNFHRLIPRMNSAAVKSDAFGTVRPTGPGLPAKYEFDLPDAMIVSVTSQAIGDQDKGPIYSRALTTIGATTDPQCPGYRTLTGNKYDIGTFGSAFVGAHADFRGARLADFLAWGAIYAYVSRPPVGADLIVYVVYINKERTQVGLVDILKIEAGDLNSYPSGDPPDERQMPYHANGWVPTDASPTDWPTTLLPELTGALDGNGDLQTGFSVDPGSAVAVEPTGYLDFIVTQVGSTTPGTDLVIVART